VQSSSQIVTRNEPALNFFQAELPSCRFLSYAANKRTDKRRENIPSWDGSINSVGSDENNTTFTSVSS